MSMTERLLPTPAHTIGPFYGHALPFPGGGDIAPSGHPDTITLHGHVLDGAGAPVPDALLDFWQAAPDGSLAGAPARCAATRPRAASSAATASTSPASAGSPPTPTAATRCARCRRETPGCRTSGCACSRGV